MRILISILRSAILLLVVVPLLALGCGKGKGEGLTTSVDRLLGNWDGTMVERVRSDSAELGTSDFYMRVDSVGEDAVSKSGYVLVTIYCDTFGVVGVARVLPGGEWIIEAQDSEGGKFLMNGQFFGTNASGAYEIQGEPRSADIGLADPYSILGIWSANNGVTRDPKAGGADYYGRLNGEWAVTLDLETSYPYYDPDTGWELWSRDEGYWEYWRITDEDIYDVFDRSMKWEYRSGGVTGMLKISGLDLWPGYYTNECGKGYFEILRDLWVGTQLELYYADAGYWYHAYPVCGHGDISLRTEYCYPETGSGIYEGSMERHVHYYTMPANQSYPYGFLGALPKPYSIYPYSTFPFSIYPYSVAANIPAINRDPALNTLIAQVNHIDRQKLIHGLYY